LGKLNDAFTLASSAGFSTTAALRVINTERKNSLKTQGKWKTSNEEPSFSAGHRMTGYGADDWNGVVC
jgi:hypothetical protein